AISLDFPCITGKTPAFRTSQNTGAGSKGNQIFPEYLHKLHQINNVSQYNAQHTLPSPVPPVRHKGFAK
ncbi:hypothetical protein, partial [Alistipes putredinis]